MKNSLVMAVSMLFGVLLRCNLSCLTRIKKQTKKTPNIWEILVQRKDLSKTQALILQPATVKTFRTETTKYPALRKRSLGAYLECLNIYYINILYDTNILCIIYYTIILYMKVFSYFHHVEIMK